MKVIGFNLTKIGAEKSANLKEGLAINTNIEILDIIKEEVEILKDSDAVKVTFAFSVLYEPEEKKENNKDKKEKDKDKQEKPLGQVSFEGEIIFASDKEESKDIIKGWKKKFLDDKYKIPLFNLILRRCSIKALELEEEVSLPLHIRTIPRLQPRQNQQQ